MSSLIRYNFNSGYPDINGNKFFLWINAIKVNWPFLSCNWEKP